MRSSLPGRASEAGARGSLLGGTGHAAFGRGDVARETAHALGELLVPREAAPMGRHVGVGELDLGGEALAHAHTHAVAHPFARTVRIEHRFRAGILSLGVGADEVLQPPRHFLVVTAAEHGPPSALVEAAGETLLAAFLVDEGRLSALLAEIAHAAPAPASRRRGRRVLAALDADVLTEGAGERVGQREDLRRAEARGLSASDAGELADDLLEAALRRERRGQSQHERD